MRIGNIKVCFKIYAGPQIEDGTSNKCWGHLLTGRRHDGDHRFIKMDTVFPESKLA